MNQSTYQPNRDDVVVIVPSVHVSLPSLEAAGVDVAAPFIIWVDQAGGAVYARQSHYMKAPGSAVWFEGPRPITGTPPEDPEDEYERGWENGREDGYGSGKSDGYEQGFEKGRAEGHASGYEKGRLVGFDQGKAAAAQEPAV